MAGGVLKIEDFTLTVTLETHVKASLEDTFAAVLDRIGPKNETPDGKPMPMKLEAWPGGRWYRDLGGGRATIGRRCRRSSGQRCWNFADRCSRCTRCFPTCSIG